MSMIALGAPAKAQSSVSVAFAASIAGSNGLTFKWDFGDGSAASAEPAPAHLFAQPGDYQVKLTVSDASGAARNASFAITVNNQAHVRGLVCSGADDAGWCWSKVVQGNGDLFNDLHFDGQTVWAASDGGALYKSTDGGKTWGLRATGMRADFMPPELAGDENSQDPHLIARCRAAPDVLWCQHHCGIFRSTDNGATWVELQAQPSSFGFAVAAHPGDPQTAWFVPAVKDMQRIPVDGSLCVTRTRDGGQTFEALRTGLPQQHCYDLVFRHGLAVDDRGEQLLMGSTTGGLWASTDGGDHWQTVSAHLPPIYAVKFG